MTMRTEVHYQCLALRITELQINYQKIKRKEKKDVPLMYQEVIMHSFD